MKYLFLHYPKCSTCTKAAGWLRAGGIDAAPRNITVDNPTRAELARWIPLSGLPVQKFFNTSGLKYKELNLKDSVKTASYDELLDLLVSDGKLIKRPLLVGDDFVLVGFREDEWKQRLGR